jgi:hypothetical protein
MIRGEDCRTGMGKGTGISLILICSKRTDLRLWSSESQGVTTLSPVQYEGRMVPVLRRSVVRVRCSCVCERCRAR